MGQDTRVVKAAKLEATPSPNSSKLDTCHDLACLANSKLVYTATQPHIFRKQNEATSSIERLKLNVDSPPSGVTQANTVTHHGLFLDAPNF